MAKTNWKKVADGLEAFLRTRGWPGIYHADDGKDIMPHSQRAEFYRRCLDKMRVLKDDNSPYIDGKAPVGIREFIESPKFLNKGGQRDSSGKIVEPIIYPTLMTELEQLNSGPYIESVLTGSIGSGKSTMALYTQAYQLYRLSRLRNPHREFGLDPDSEIEIIFQSVSGSLAKMVDYDRFKSIVDSSPYFQNEFPYDKSLKATLVFPRRIIVRPVHGGHTAALGQNVIGGVIDELNLMAVVENSKSVVGGGLYDQAVENYNSIARRRESRFLKNGRIPGMLCLVSSAQYQGQFTDKKIAEAKQQGENTKIFVFDKRIWEVKPDRYSKKTFAVFVGDSSRRPRILTPKEKVRPEDEGLILNVPVDFRTTFEVDIFNALRDIGGISTQNVTPFIPNADGIKKAMGAVPEIMLDQSTDLVSSRPRLAFSKFQRLDQPRFGHIDLSINGDCAGLAIGWVPQFVDVKRGDQYETLPVIQYDVLLEIRPPVGGEIDFGAIRSVLYKLIELGLPLKWVTLDSFQSRDTVQNLNKLGVRSGIQSVDLTPDPYVALKSAINDGRVKAPVHEKATRELLQLEWVAPKRKVDHPPRGSKDVVDAMAGVAYGLLTRRELWFRHGVSGRVPGWLQNAKAKALDEAKASAASGDLEVVSV